MRVVSHTEARLELSMNQILDRIGELCFGLIFSGFPTSMLLPALMETQRAGNTKDVSGLVLGLFAFGICGCAIIWKGVSRDFRARCTFDRTTGQVVLQRHSLWKRQTIQQPLHFIKDVEVGEHTSNFVSKGHKTYGIFLILRSGERVPISFADLTSPRHYNVIAETIRQFLKPHSTKLNSGHL